jgi:hypothetical protein
MQQLEDQHPRCLQFLSKLSPLLSPISPLSQKIEFKQLQQCVQEYRGLMVKEERFAECKKVCEEAGECLERVGIVGR